MQFAVCVHHEYEELELFYPFYRLREAGFSTSIFGPQKETIYNGKHGYPCKSEKAFQEINSTELDGIIIPGGYAPDKLRREKKLLDIVHALHESTKLIAYICHAGWVAISAGIMKGVRCTSAPSIRDDLVNAGAIWSDEPMVMDRNVISSRGPNDLPHFCQGILQFLKVKT
jgi:protease I